MVDGELASKTSGGWLRAVSTTANPFLTMANSVALTVSHLVWPVGPTSGSEWENCTVQYWAPWKNKLKQTIKDLLFLLTLKTLLGNSAFNIVGKTSSHDWFCLKNSTASTVPIDELYPKKLRKFDHWVHFIIWYNTFPVSSHGNYMMYCTISLPITSYCCCASVSSSQRNLELTSWSNGDSSRTPQLSSMNQFLTNQYSFNNHIK